MLNFETRPNGRQQTVARKKWFGAKPRTQEKMFLCIYEDAVLEPPCEQRASS